MYIHCFLNILWNTECLSLQTFAVSNVCRFSGRVTKWSLKQSYSDGDILYLWEKILESFSLLPHKEDKDTVGEQLSVSQKVLYKKTNQQAPWSWTSQEPELLEASVCGLSYTKLLNLWYFLMISCKHMTLTIDTSLSLESFCLREQCIYYSTTWF